MIKYTEHLDAIIIFDECVKCKVGPERITALIMYTLRSLSFSHHDIFVLITVLMVNIRNSTKFLFERLNSFKQTSKFVCE